MPPGLKDTTMVKNIAGTLRDTKIHNLDPKRDDKHPHLFHMGVLPGGGGGCRTTKDGRAVEGQNLELNEFK